MGEYSHFRFGQKAPNNGRYREIGETGNNVNDPQVIKLEAGEKFPQTKNHNRVWTYDNNN